ncbi:glycosyltransferase family 4 protein [Neobacillus vireti]|uniref:glycosyltransferase family 4 protein n=1 Tax=Neobacillus vireti TaxID=220686 RepID=UPI002FFF3C58
MYDFLMIGWELDYSRNRAMLDSKKFSIKRVDIKNDNFILRTIKIFIQTFFALIGCNTNTVYIPAFNQVNAPLIILWAKIFRKRLIIDILVSEYDTLVEDRKLVDKNSFKAKKALFFDKLSLKYGDILICDTELHKEYFIKKFNCPREKIVVIPVGAEEHFTSLPQTPQRDFNVVFYGGFSPLHGIDTILKAAACVKDDKDIKFTLVGNGQTKKQMVKLAKELKLTNVTFVDRVEYQELPVFLSNFDVGLGIFGLTDKARRVVPNKVYQMAACKKPVVTMETDGIKEVFKNQTNIYLISTENDIGANLASAIRELKNNPNKANLIAEKGYQLMKTEYSVESIRDMFEALVR